MSALIAIIIGIVLVVVFIKLALGVIGAVLGIGLAVVAYFAAEKLIGQGR